MRKIFIILIILIGIILIAWKIFQENEVSKMREFCKQEHSQEEVCFEDFHGIKDVCGDLIQLCIDEIKKIGYPQ